MSDFEITVLRIKIKGDEKIPLPPYPGSTLRGAFGLSLKRLTCVTRQQDCETCMLNQKCVYATSFETIFSGDSPYLKGTDRAPHPVLIYPVQPGKSITRKGGAYTLGMTVFGNRKEYLPFYIYALARLGRIGLGRTRGKFHIVSVRQLTSFRAGKEIYDPAAERLDTGVPGLSARKILQTPPRHKKMLLETLSPLRLKSEHKLVTRPTLSHILLSAAQRLRVLSSLYGEDPIDLLATLNLDAVLRRVAVENAVFRWRDISRYSRRQQAAMKLGGVEGRMALSGHLAPVYPLLRLGQALHIGKNTAFGLGRYQLKPVE